eukprot:3927470-Alexandrium_andersonii.AAC.1
MAAASAGAGAATLCRVVGMGVQRRWPFGPVSQRSGPTAAETSGLDQQSKGNGARWATREAVEKGWWWWWWWWWKPK